MGMRPKSPCPETFPGHNRPIPTSILLPCVAALSWLGNALVLLAYHRPRHRARPVVRLILVRAVVDICVLVFALGVFRQLIDIAQIPYLLPLVFGMLHFTHTASIWFTVVIMADRFSAVRFPLKHSQVNRSLVGWILISVTFATSLSFNFPRFFETFSQPVCYFANASSNTSFFYVPQVANYRNTNTTYTIFYIGYASTIVKYVGPLCVIAFLNSGIYIVLRRSTSNSRLVGRSSSPRSALGSTTIMLVAEACIFLLCMTPPSVTNLIEAIDPNLYNTLINAQGLHNLVNVIGLLPSAMTCPTYVIFGSDFRNALATAIWKKRSNNHLYRTQSSVVSSDVRLRRLQHGNSQTKLDYDSCVETLQKASVSSIPMRRYQVTESVVRFADDIPPISITKGLIDKKLSVKDFNEIRPSDV